MKLRIVLAWLAMISFTVWGAETRISKAEFTQQFYQLLQQEYPQTYFTSDAELTIVTDDFNGYQLTINLGSAYDVYSSDPSSLSEVYNQRLSSVTQQHKVLGTEDIQSIMPVIKPLSYMQTAYAQLKKSGYQKPDLPFYYKKLNDDLYQLYVFDREQRMRFVMREDVDKLDIADNIEHIAHKNLSTHFAQVNATIKLVKTPDSGQLFLFSVDENYEASVLTAFDYLSQVKFENRGELMLFIPARNMALIVDSADEKSVQLASAIAQQNFQQLAYAISPHGYVKRDDHWIKADASVDRKPVSTH